MSAKESISIIVPAYNNEDEIERCVESIVGQLKKNDELIIVNDYSSDHTAEILFRFRENKRITVIDNNGPHGVSGARNKGLAKSKNSFVTFVDADDALMPDWRRNVEKYLNTSIDLIVYGYESVDVDTRIIRHVCPKRLDISTSDEIYDLDKRSLFASSCNKIYKKNRIMDNNIRFNTNATILEDYEFNLNYLRVCKRIICIPKSLYKYIYKQNSASSSFNSEVYDRYLYIKELRKRVYVGNLSIDECRLHDLEVKSLIECINYLYKGNLRKNKDERIKVIKQLYKDGELDILRDDSNEKSLAYRIIRFSSRIRNPVFFDFTQSTLRLLKNRLGVVNYLFRLLNHSRKEH